MTGHILSANLGRNHNMAVRRRISGQLLGGSTLDKSAIDQANKFALLFNVVLIKSWSLWLKLAPSLRVFPVDSSNVLVFSTSSMRKSHPILGSRSSPIKVGPAPGCCSILLAMRTDFFSRKLAM